MTHLAVPGFWRLNKAKYGFVGRRCKGCGRVQFPPRSVCGACGSVGHEVAKIDDSGQILTWTTIHVAPSGFEAPYTVALVRFANGAVVPGQVVGNLATVAIGASVRTVFRKLNETEDGLILYGFKFELAN